MRRRFRLCWEFYKSTLAVNIGVSVALSAFLFPIFLKSLAFMLISGGPAIAFIQKEFGRTSDYYFYHNCGLSKVFLYGWSTGLNAFISIILILIDAYVIRA